MRTWMLVVFGALVAAGLATAAAPARSSRASANVAGPLKIGRVDLAVVLKQYARRKDLEAEVVAIKRRAGAKERLLIDQVNRHRAAIEQLAMGTPEREELEKKLAGVAKDLGQHRRTNLALINSRLVDVLAQLYEDILREVEELGREEGYDLILKDQSTEAKAATYNDMVLQISQRGVLYSKPEYDLTAKVADRLNERYAARKKADAAKSREKSDQTSPAGNTLGNTPGKEK